MSYDGKQGEDGMKKMMKGLLASTLMASSMLATAGNLNDVQLGHVGARGSGCPGGTVDSILSPDKKSLSILFDGFVLEAGPMIGKRMDRKNCTVAIPVHVPNGLSVSLVAVDYRGYNFIPKKAQSQLRVEYFFAGRKGPRFMKTFRGGLDDEYVLQNKLALVANSWSKCGDDVNLRIATSMRLRNSNRHEDAMSTLDSIDLNAGIVYKLQYKKCKQTPVEEEDDWGDDW